MVRQEQNNKKILRMSPKRYKRRNNILYRLRKKGIRCVTKERTIFIPYGKNPCDIPASLQKMRYDKQGEIVQVVCLVDSVTKGGEYTLCGNAIPDSAMEYEGAERVDEGFCGSIRDVTCADCINKITYIRSLK